MNEKKVALKKGRKQVAFKLRSVASNERNVALNERKVALNERKVLLKQRQKASGFEQRNVPLERKADLNEGSHFE